MNSPPSPCMNGDVLQDVDTPSLLVDMDALEYNIDHMVSTVISLSPTCMIRPHAKASKCVEITHMQIERSKGRTVGVCCQKVCEAIAMVEGGIMDVFVCNEIVSPRKIDRLVQLSLQKNASVSLLVDDSSNIDTIVDSILRSSTQKEAKNHVFRVLVEVDVGQNRCGVRDAQQVISLARKIMSYGNILEFAGIQAYHGAAQHVRDWSHRRDIVCGVVEKARSIVDALAAQGIPCPIVTGGGTGTFEFEAASGVFTEIQPGSYSLGDADYAKNLDREGHACWIKPFRPALFLLCQVMSRTESEKRCVVDVGLKAQSTDSGPSAIVGTVDQYTSVGGGLGLSFKEDSSTGGHFDLPAAALLDIKGISDEHTTIVSKDADYLPPIKDLLLLFPGHCDPTVNHFDYLVPFRCIGNKSVEMMGGGGQHDKDEILGSAKCVVQHDPWRLWARGPGY